MALIFVDPFDHYSSGTNVLERGYTSLGAPAVETLPVKDGRACIRPSTWSLLSPPLPGGPYSGRLVFAFWFRYTGTVTSLHDVFRTYSSTGHLNLAIYMNSSKQLGLYRNTTELQTGSTVLSPDTWYFIELRVVTSNSIAADDCVLRIGGSEEINLAATTDTLYLGAADVWKFYFEVASGGATAHYFDSVAVYDATGTAWNADTFEGVHRFQNLAPDGEGTTNDFVGQDADSTNNYLNVDEEPPDGDTTYNQSSTVGHIDLHTVADLSGTIPSVKGVHTIARARKDTGGPRTFRKVTRSGSTNYYGSSKYLAEGEYKFYYDIEETDPDTGVAWTEAGANAAEFGIEVEA